MSIKAALYDRLQNDAGVTAIVGDQVYQHDGPQNADLDGVSRVIFERSDQERESYLGGRSALSQAVFYVYSYADTASDREALSEAVRLLLETDDPEVWSGVDVRRCAVTDEDDEIERDGDGRQTGRYRTRSDVSIWYIRG